jgi:flavorubredoxin
MMANREGVEAQEADGAAFGFHGCSGGAVKLLNKDMLEVRSEIVAPVLRIEQRPYKEGLKPCHQLGKKIARAFRRGLSAHVSS